MDQGRCRAEAEIVSVRTLAHGDADIDVVPRATNVLALWESARSLCVNPGVGIPVAWARDDRAAD